MGYILRQLGEAEDGITQWRNMQSRVSGECSTTTVFSLTVRHSYGIVLIGTKLEVAVPL